MKIKILSALIVLSISTFTFAQEKETLDKHVLAYTEKIEKIVFEYKAKMNKEIDELDIQFKNGSISKTEQEEQKKEIADRYEQIINQKIDEEKNTLDKITKDAAQNTLLNNQEGKHRITISTHHKGVVKYENTNKNHPKNKLDSEGLVLSIGSLNLTNDSAPYNFFNDSSEIRFGQSTSINIGIKNRKQLGKFTSPLFFDYGIALRLDSHNLGRNRVFAQGTEELYIKQFTTGDLKKSELKVQYLEVPLDLIFVLNPKYLDYEGERYLDTNKNQLTLGIGLYGDLKIGNKIKYKYSTVESSRSIFKQKVENGLNPFLFGAKLSMGYAGFNLFVKKDFIEIYNKDAQLNNKMGLQVGIELAGFEF